MLRQQALCYQYHYSHDANQMPAPAVRFKTELRRVTCTTIAAAPVISATSTATDTMNK